MTDDMNDDLENRLRRLGRADVPKLDESRVDAIAKQILAEPQAGRRPSWITAVAAACVLVVVAAAIALRDDGQNSVRPSNPTETLVETTRPEPASTSTVDTAAPPTAPDTTTGTESTVGATTPPTVTTAAPTTTLPPNTIPPASFALTVERVGNELHFSWPRYTGSDATRYVLVRIDGDRLTSWPVPDSRVAVTTADLGTTNASVTLRAQPRRRWVLAVIGANRRLIAVSSVAISD